MSNSSEIVFGGTTSPAHDIDWSAVRERQPRWVRVFEQAMVQLTSTDEGRAMYGDVNKGATIRQAWNAHGLITGQHAVCVLASGRPPADTKGISSVVAMAPSDLTGAMARSFRLGRKTTLQMFSYDGKTGHCITMFGFDEASDSFRYHDTWPGRSLLCKENNAAGVDARLCDDGLWALTKAESTRVVYAVFFSPMSWADLNDVRYRIRYDDFQRTDFWEFFNLSELERSERKKNGYTFTTVKLQTGGFREHIDLEIEIDERSSIVRGTLSLARAWVVEPASGINPFACDITRSFLGALAPEPDTGLRRAAASVDALGDLDTVRALVERQSADGLEQTLQATYLGLVEDATWPGDFAWLEVRNVRHDGTEVLRIDVDLGRG